ncbi:hypothetical protein [Sinorhizobium americanum]|uniref:hypothetical protein n=1 Tax=Sinorhizobium americanum TaxID=194963 RepID=UPI000ABC7A68|nr:hypothetical protein [Sinorhizobium americanum]
MLMADGGRTNSCRFPRTIGAKIVVNDADNRPRPCANALWLAAYRDKGTGVEDFDGDRVAWGFLFSQFACRSDLTK